MKMYQFSKTSLEIHFKRSRFEMPSTELPQKKEFQFSMRNFLIHLYAYDLMFAGKAIWKFEQVSISVLFFLSQFNNVNGDRKKERSKCLQFFR